ncbi:MAG: FAD:protein FMN transferase [Microbacteriaceae bacterium]
MDLNSNWASNIAADALRAAHTPGGSVIVVREFTVMGTVAHIVLVAGTDAMLDDLVESARFLNDRWSRFIPTSDISRLNNAEGEPTEVDPITVSLAMEMLAARRLTDGSYDPTILPRLIAEGYSRSRVDETLVTTLPASARWPVDTAGTTISGNTITLPIGMTLDPGGIGKGFAADVLVTRALELGALGALVEIGGDLRIAGTAPDGENWHIAIDDPHHPGETYTRVNLVDGAVATSSTLTRTWEHDGQSRHHLIDTETGVPLQSDVVSVSVIAVSAAIAEVVAKCGFLREDFLDWAPTLGTAALVIHRDGSSVETRNWKDYS